VIRRASSVLIIVLAVLAGAAPTRGSDLAEMTSKGTLRVLAGQGEQSEMFSFQNAGEPGLEREIVETPTRHEQIAFTSEVMRSRPWAQ